MKIPSLICIGVLLITACAPQHLQTLPPIDLSGSLTTNHKVQDRVIHAQKQVENVLKGDLKPSIAVQLRTVQADLNNAVILLGEQATTLQSKQKEINTQTDKANAATDKANYYIDKYAEAKGLIWKYRFWLILSAISNVLLIAGVVCLFAFRSYLKTIPVIGLFFP